RGDPCPAHVEVEHGSRLGVLRVDERHGDRRAQRRRQGAARDLTHGLLARHDGVASASGAATFRHESDEYAGPLGWPGLCGGTAHEITLLREMHDSPEPGLCGQDLAPELMTVERHPGLEPEGVATREPCRDEPERLT